MANVINMGAGGASFVNGTVAAGCRVVYSDGFGVQDKTPTAEESISVIFNSLIYAPVGVDISPATSTEIPTVYLVNSDFTAVKSFDATFANNSWEKIINACHSGNVPDSWIVGNSKTMTINGSSYQIDIIGKNHDTYADGSGKAPLTFQLHDCYAQVKSMNNSDTNSGGWKNSVMRQTHLPAILALMPSDVQNGIRAVNKVTESATTSDKLFLLSEYEIFGSTTYSTGKAGTQYDYYKAGNSAAKTQNNYESQWWERSKRYSGSEQFCCVQTSGTPSYNSAGNPSGFSFGFCF